MSSATIGALPDFASAAETVVGVQARRGRDGGKTRRQWASPLVAYAVPVLRGKRVDTITSADVAPVLPIWNAKRVTATMVPSRSPTGR